MDAVGASVIRVQSHLLRLLPLGVTGTWRKEQFPMVRKIKAKLVLQLRAEGLSGRAIAASQQISRNSVAAVLEAADAAKLGWDDVADLPDGEVYSLLFPGRGEHASVFAEPDWAEVHREMARVGVTMKLLHGEVHRPVRGLGVPGDGVRPVL